MQHYEYKKADFREPIFKKNNRKFFFYCRPSEELNRLFYYWFLALGVLIIALLLTMEFIF